MVEKYEIEEDGSKDDVLKEFGVVVTRDASGQVVPGSYTEWKAREKAKTRMPLAMVILGAAIGVILVATLIMAVAKFSRPATSGIEVPNVVGMSVTQAKQVITAAGLRAQEQGQKSEKPAGTILSTKPDAGTPKKAGSDVVLVVAEK